MSRKPRVFRIFISSTFADFKIERNALQKDVFPRLRKLCMENGTGFQAIDLRWGVSKEASRFHRTMDICLEEIKRCQKLSPQPNFIVLLGNRYGWKPIPLEIEYEDFNNISAHLEDERDKDILNEWYILDKNSIPPVYELKPREGELINYQKWMSIENKIHDILERNIGKLNLDEEKNIKYSASATEQEIYAGALNVDNANEHIFCFFREISDIPLNNKNAEIFYDIENKEKLKRLKNKLRKILPDKIFEYNLKYKKYNHKSYLKSFCDDVYRSLLNIILKEISLIKTIDQFEEEIGNHTLFLKDNLTNFIGRDIYLKRIHEYIINEKNNHPLVIYGESGSGKSALLAKSIQNSECNFPHSIIIYRFIGVTPDSSNIRLLLLGICKQIASNHKNSDIPDTIRYEELVAIFLEYLTSRQGKRPLIIYIDAIDQLLESYNAHNLIWLPNKLAHNVKIVISLIPQETLHSINIKIPKANFLKISAMTNEETNIFLNNLLKQANRTLQKEQYSELLKKVNICGLPLYLKLVFEQVRRWKSYYKNNSLSDNIIETIFDLIKDLSSETNHGSIFVESCLCYLAASKNGLTEDELMDLLSSDKEIMRDFRRRFPKSPKVNRLPFIVWSRLFKDLDPYLALRSVDNTFVLSFFHPTSFLKAINSFYFKEGKELTYHQRLARYFSQQFVKDHKGQTAVPSLRKLSQLPFQLVRGKLWEELRIILTDFDFVHSKISDLGPSEILDDYEFAVNQNKENKDNNIFLLMQKFLNLTLDIVYKDPAQFPGQFSGRMAVNKKSALFNMYKSIKKFDGHPWICPLFNSLKSPAGPLLYTLYGHNNWINDIVVIKNGEIIATVSDDNTIKLWDVEKKEELTTISDFESIPKTLAVTPDNRKIICGCLNGVIKVWNLNKGVVTAYTGIHADEVRAIATTNDSKKVVSSSKDGTINVWDIESGNVIRTLFEENDWMRDLILTADNKYIISVSDNRKIIIWDLEKGVRLNRLLEQHDKRINAIAVSETGESIGTASADDSINIYDITDINIPKLKIRLQGHEGWVRSTDFFHNSDKLLSGSDDKSIAIWDIKTGKKINTLTGHTKGVWKVKIAPNDDKIFSVSGDNTIRFWNPDYHEENVIFGHNLSSINGVLITPDKSHIISCAHDMTIKIWNRKTRENIKTLKGHNGFVTGIAITRNGKKLISASHDTTLKIWDLHNYKEVKTLSAHTSWVHAVALTTDDKLAISASHDQSLSVWDIEKEVEVRQLAKHVQDVTCVAVLPNTHLAVSGSFDKTIKIWDLDTGRNLLSIKAHTEGIRGVVVTPDGKKIISCSEDRTIKVFNLKDGKIIKTLAGHDGVVWSLTVMPDGKKLISTSDDKTLKIWDIEKGEIISTFTGESAVLCCDISSDGKIIVAGEENSRIHLLEFIE